MFTVVCSLLILLAGLTALTGLGLEDLPQLAPTRVSVSANFPAASPEVVEQLQFMEVNMMILFMEPMQLKPLMGTMGLIQLIVEEVVTRLQEEGDQIL